MDPDALSRSHSIFDKQPDKTHFDFKLLHLAPNIVVKLTNYETSGREWPKWALAMKTGRPHLHAPNDRCQDACCVYQQDLKSVFMAYGLKCHDTCNCQAIGRHNTDGKVIHFSVYHTLRMGWGNFKIVNDILQISCGTGSADNHQQKGKGVWNLWAPSQYKNGLSWYPDFHYKDRTVVRASYFCYGNSSTGNTTSSYWDSPSIREKMRHNIVNVYITLIMLVLFTIYYSSTLCLQVFWRQLRDNDRLAWFYLNSAICVCEHARN